ncbi:ABC transporter substrate-binding protein [Kineococcus sp. SYSU DK003]|uniref:ABC transporter substrate-binding protein n=1 Tax=Kineococcus sp. SYSU DK003 TaxID=3383124 RepID=UPI003D7ECE78
MERTASPSPASGPARRTLLLASLAGFGTFAAACSAPGGGPDAAADQDGAGSALIIGMTASDIPLLDIGMAQNEGYEGLRFVANQLYDSLTRFDLTDGSVIPPVVAGLAESWQPDEMGTSWTFTLRQGVTFHDGTPWNADAAVFNLRRYTDDTFEYFYQELNGQAGLAIAGISAATAVDEYTVRIDCVGPWAYLPSDLTTVYMGSPTAIQEAGNDGFGQKPVGTGPFTFVSVERGQSLELAANADYWNGKPAVSNLILRPIPDTTARVAALRTGEVNWIEVPPPDDVDSLQSAGFQIETNSYDHIWPWCFDTTQPPWNDVRVRQAANYAINRQSLVDNVLQGTAEPALQVCPKANAAYRPENDLYSYDPDRAKQLLAEAGVSGGITATLSYPTSGSGNMIPGPMNEALQRDLAAVGINVELQPIEWASMLTDYFVGNIPGGASAINISLSFQQEGFWNNWLGTGVTNVTGWHNPQVEALFTQAQATLDEAGRAELYAQASAIITQEAPWLFVVNDRNPRVLAANVDGFVEPQSWFVDVTDVSVT